MAPEERERGMAASAPEVLNLRGEVCPYTFVKTKLALERLAPGQTLRVIVDNGQSAADVPRSVSAEGHRVLEVAADGGTTWSILIRKASAKAPALPGSRHAG